MFGFKYESVYARNAEELREEFLLIWDALVERFSEVESVDVVGGFNYSEGAVVVPEDKLLEEVFNLLEFDMAEVAVRENGEAFGQARFIIRNERVWQAALRLANPIFANDVTFVGDKRNDHHIKVPPGHIVVKRVSRMGNGGYETYRFGRNPERTEGQKMAEEVIEALG